MEDTFPDLGSLSDKELKDLIDKLTEEENEISYKRRVLHGKIDILRAELVNRLRQKRERGDSLFSGDDVEQLTEILAGKAQPDRRTAGRLSARRRPMAVHCPECGFANPEGANYCQKCGAYLGAGPSEGGEDPTTMTYTVDETGDMQPVDIDEVVERAGRGAGDPLRRRAGRRELHDRRGPHQYRAQPRRRRLPRRRDRLAQSRAAGPPPRRPLHRRPRLAQRHLREPPADRVAPARRRRRDPGRQVQAQLPGEVWRGRLREAGPPARTPPAGRARH